MELGRSFPQIRQESWRGLASNPCLFTYIIKDVRYWIEHKVYPEDEIAVRFHHKLVWIHLFPNGNGRHARLMTDVLLKDILKQRPFYWDIKRDVYLKALKLADKHDYLKLLKLLSKQSCPTP